MDLGLLHRKSEARLAVSTVLESRVGPASGGCFAASPRTGFSGQRPVHPSTGHDSGGSKEEGRGGEHPACQVSPTMERSNVHVVAAASNSGNA